MIKHYKNEILGIALLNLLGTAGAVSMIFFGGFLLVPGAPPRQEILESTRDISNVVIVHQLFKLQANFQYWYNVAHVFMLCWLVCSLANLTLVAFVFLADRAKQSNVAIEATQIPPETK